MLCNAARLATDDEDLGERASPEAKGAEMERRREVLWRAASGSFSAHRGAATVFSGGFRLPEFTPAFGPPDADAEVPLGDLAPGERCTLRLHGDKGGEGGEGNEVEDLAEVVFTLVGGGSSAGVGGASAEEARTLALATALRYLTLDPRHARFGALYFAGTAEPAFWSAVVAFCATGSTLPAFVPDDGSSKDGHGLSRAPRWWARTRAYWDGVLARSRDSGGKDADCLFASREDAEGAEGCPVPGCTLRHAVPRVPDIESDDDEPAD